MVFAVAQWLEHLSVKVRSLVKIMDGWTESDYLNCSLWVTFH